MQFPSALLLFPLGISRNVASGVGVSELQHWGQLGAPVRGCPLPKSLWHAGLPLRGRLQAGPLQTEAQTLLSEGLEGFSGGWNPLCRKARKEFSDRLGAAPLAEALSAQPWPGKPGPP